MFVLYANKNGNSEMIQNIINIYYKVYRIRHPLRKNEKKAKYNNLV